eukprot:scaffold1319_cov126-Cylindrotheca_fusiformis.AAC.24
MKFVALAMAALIGVVDAKKSFSNSDFKVLESRAKEGKINKQTLMRGATPYSAAAKRMLDEDEWEINGDYSVEFEACVSLVTGNEDLFEEDIVNYAANGLVKSERSYITFTVCKSNYCSSQSDDEKMTFITDVATYFMALAEYLPNQVRQYCEGCEENEDYCLGNYNGDQNEDEDSGDEEDEDSGDEDGDEDGEEGEDRKLARSHRRKLANNVVVEYIDCDKCDAYECFADNDQERKLDQDEYDIDGAIEWLNGLAECQELENNYYENTALYAGLLCNEDGDGVEIGVFMNDECSLYTTVKSFQDVMTYSDKTYYQMSQEIVEYTFTSQFDCQDIEIQYINEYTEQDEDEEDNENDDEAPEAADYCEDLFDNTVNMYDCDVDQNGDNEDEEQNDDDYLANYEWYSYEISDEDAEDAQAVCKVLNGFDTDSGKSKSYKGKTVYDSKSSGQMYDYKKARNSSGGGKGGIFAIVLFTLLVVGGVAFFVMNKKSSDSKRAPLINANNGHMA